MKNKEIKKEIIIDYVAKESAARTKKSFLKECTFWGIAITYLVYTLYSITALDETIFESLIFLSLMIFFLLAVPLNFIYMSIYDDNTAKNIAKNIEPARKFLLEKGQEASRENINILLNRYYKGNWQKIEDMLYEDRKVFLSENIELVSGNESGRLKEALKKGSDEI